MVKHIVSPTPGSHLQPLAATPVVASGRQWPPSFSSHRQPLAPPCGQSSGRQWPPEFSSSHRQPLAATCSQSSGRQCPPAPIEWPPVATSIWFFIPPAFYFHRQPLAATCQSSGRSQSSGRKWPPEQVAAFAKIKFAPFCTLSV